MTPARTTEHYSYSDYNGLVYEIITSVSTSAIADRVKFQCNGTFANTEKEIHAVIDEMMINP